MKSTKMIIASISLSFLFLGCEKEEEVEVYDCKCEIVDSGVIYDNNEPVASSNPFRFVTTGKQIAQGRDGVDKLKRDAHKRKNNYEEAYRKAYECQQNCWGPPTCYCDEEVDKVRKYEGVIEVISCSKRD